MSRSPAGAAEPARRGPLKRPADPPQLPAGRHPRTSQPARPRLGIEKDTNKRIKEQAMKLQPCICGLVVAGLFACSPFCFARGGGGSGGHGGGEAHGQYRNNYSSSYGYSSYQSSYDFTLYPYTPTPEQQEIAKERVKAYYAAIRKGRRRPAKHRYIAVETLRPTKKQREDYLRKRLAAKGGQGRSSSKRVEPGQLRCLMVFDTQKQQFVGSNCYLVEKLPSAGTVTQFESVGAEYVGQL
jgi:hypothetical protein